MQPRLARTLTSHSLTTRLCFHQLRFILLPLAIALNVAWVLRPLCREARASRKWTQTWGLSDDENQYEDVSKLSGPSADILHILRQRVPVSSVLNGAKLGRSVLGIKKYLSNKKLNETDIHLLRRHLSLDLGCDQYPVRMCFWMSLSS